MTDLVARIEEYLKYDVIQSLPPSMAQDLLREALAALKELELRVSDKCIRGMLTRLERDHHELRAAWENETGKPWTTDDAIERDLE